MSGGATPKRDRTQITGWRSRAVWLAVLAPLVLSIACAALIPGGRDMPTWTVIVFSLMATSLGVTGALVVTREPRNAVGWILWVASVVTGVSTFTFAYATYVVTTDRAQAPDTIFVAWLSQIGFFPAIVGIIIFMPLLFPDGRFLSRRWLWAGVYGVAVVGTIVAGEMFAPGPIGAFPMITNPIGLTAFASTGPIVAFANGPAVILGAAGLGIASAVLRYRRGSAVERAQLRWFAAAVGLTIAMLVLSVVLASEPIGQVAWLGGIIALSLIPVAIGIAILRYRLYDIDRVISRTLGWAIVTAVLVTTLVVGIALLQAVLAPFAKENTIAVAASTLIAFALFQPLRRRVQRVVDRRFDRERYDGQRTVDGFAEHLRSDVDLASIRASLASTAEQAVRPTDVTVWLSPKGVR